MATITAIPQASESPRLLRNVSTAVDRIRLSVVIVNYYQWRNTVALVRCLCGAQTIERKLGEIIVIDNHSPRSGTAEMLRRRSDVQLIRWKRNRGFAQAANEGCRRAIGDWVLLLNPDMTLPRGFLDSVAELTNRLDIEAPDAGVIGLGLRDPEGSIQCSAGSYPTLFSTLAGLTLPRRVRKYRSLPADRRSRVDWVTGCAMLIRRKCFDEIGGFDPAFFLYYEDVDFCRRAARAGWSVYYEPRIAAVHFNPLHRRPLSARMRLITRHSLLTYASKYWPKWQLCSLAKIVGWEARFRMRASRDRLQKRLTALLAHLAERAEQGDCESTRRRILSLANRLPLYEGS